MVERNPDTVVAGGSNPSQNTAQPEVQGNEVAHCLTKYGIFAIMFHEVCGSETYVGGCGTESGNNRCIFENRLCHIFRFKVNWIVGISFLVIRLFKGVMDVCENILFVFSFAQLVRENRLVFLAHHP